MNTNIRIAFCISGQPRSWQKCLPTWKKFEKRLIELTGGTVDYFCHAWDFNTPPHAILSRSDSTTGIKETYTTIKGIKITDQERELLEQEINPVTIVWENEEVSKRRATITHQRGEIHANEQGGPALAWAASQFYGVMRSADIKRRHEIDNFFQYDYVFKLRFDLFLDEHQIDWFLDPRSKDFGNTSPNTVYTCHTRKDNLQFPFHRFGDIFWYSDSPSFDKIAAFYDWLPVIGKRSFISNQETCTEHALYFFAKMIKMNVHAISVDPKIFRQSDYLELKKQAGLEQGLGGHELI